MDSIGTIVPTKLQIIYRRDQKNKPEKDGRGDETILVCGFLTITSVLSGLSGWEMEVVETEMVTNKVID